MNIWTKLGSTGICGQHCIAFVVEAFYFLKLHIRKHCGFNFSTKLAVLNNSLPHKKALTLPSLTTQPHQVLASDLVPYSDIQQVRVHC